MSTGSVPRRRILPLVTNRVRQLPSRLRVAIGLLALVLVAQTLWRAVFWLQFHATDGPASLSQLRSAFWVGFKFDLRFDLLLLLPMFLLWFVPRLDPSRSSGVRIFWARYLSVLVCLLLVVYSFDLGHYAYLETHLDVSALRFLDTPAISAKMLWQSYPLGWASMGVALLVILVYLGLRRWFARAFAVPQKWARRPYLTAILVGAIASGIYGKASYYPLRWSDAFSSTHRFASDLALNPPLYFLDTLCTSEKEEYDRAEVERRYERVSTYLGVETPDRDTLSFARHVKPTRLTDGRPNVVVVLMESFAAHKTGILGNSLDPSPHFDRIARDGYFWRRFYTPQVGTARGVFASLTGIPDTTTKRTASRNPQIVKQYTIPSALEAYEKHYFLGGSANWANIRGLLAHNIDDLIIHEEGSYEELPRIDVWGVSDLHLFEYANDVFSRAKEPFFAFVHLSGNHGPYTIPDDNRGFQLRTVGDAELHANGFSSSAEFNSFRFLDHSLGVYLETARQEDYFANTLFFFFGDNGSSGPAPHFPKAEDALGLCWHHTPFLIYGPGMKGGGKVFDDPATQMDLMPTLAGAIGARVPNTTIGRNLLDPDFDRFAYVQTQIGLDTHIGLLSEDFYSLVSADGSKRRLHSYHSENPKVDVAESNPERMTAMAELALGLFHASKWMMYNNSEDQAH